MDKLQLLIKKIIAFRDERHWEQFHTPRNLTTALSIEAAELQELLLWKSDQEVSAYLQDPSCKQELAHEVADVLTFAFLFCHATGIDPLAAIEQKLEINAKKYPVALSKGKATKYTELPRS